MAGENQKEPSFGRFLFGLAIIGMIALVFIISPAYLERIYTAERQSVQAILGDAEEEIYQEAYSEPSQELQEGAAAVARDAGQDKPISQWANDRATAMWLWGNLISYRLVMLFSWMLCILPLILGAFIDGYYVRESRKYSFFSQSPIRHKVGVRSATLIFGATVCSILLPLAFSPLIVPGALIGIGMASWLWISNLQKRL